MPCTVCLDSLTCTEVFELDCGHVLHVECLVKLIYHRTRRCPQCRAKIRLTIPQIQNICTLAHNTSDMANHK